MEKLTLESAKKLMRDNISNVNLQRHCVAVGKALAAYFDYYKTQNRETGGLSREEWEMVGLLHDADWEKTANEPDKHTVVTLDWLNDFEVAEEITNVIKSHNNKHTHLREPQTLLEWTLECCDELTGFIVAATLVQPSKKIADVGVESVIGKFKKKEFARAVDRTQITQCEEKVAIPVKDFVEITLYAMKRDSEELGL